MVGGMVLDNPPPHPPEDTTSRWEAAAVCAAGPLGGVIARQVANLLDLSLWSGFLMIVAVAITAFLISYCWVIRRLQKRRLSSSGCVS